MSAHWLSRRYLMIGMAMLATAGLTILLKPAERMAGQGPVIDLETMIPRQFGNWQLIEALDRLRDGANAGLANRIYNQALSRTYVNRQGGRIMLSIAYGSEQSKELQVHRPEVCYRAQGFAVSATQQAEIRLGGAIIPVMRMVANASPRVEPITYWITVGSDAVVRGGWEQKWAKFKFGLLGKVPDGMLVRVSNISGDAASSYALHEAFLDGLYWAMAPQDRGSVFGRVETGSADARH